MVQHQRSGYDSAPEESTEFVSPLKWHLILVTLGATIVAGVVLIVLLVKGTADPPQASNLIIDLTSPDAVAADGQPEWLTVASLRSYNFPITIEATAAGTSDAAWGLWLRSLSAQFTFRLRNDGYYSLLSAGGWQEFMHIRPAENSLYLHIEADGVATVRINDEIVWQGTIHPDLLEWGIIHPFGSTVDWNYIRLYAS